MSTRFGFFRVLVLTQVPLRMSAAPSPRTRLPPEVLLKVLSLSLHTGKDIPARNARLASLSLISRQIQPIAFSLLYGDLQTQFGAAGIARNLERSLALNPKLAPLVVRLKVECINVHDWTNEWIGDVRKNPQLLAAAERRAERVEPDGRLRSCRRANLISSGQKRWQLQRRL